MRTLKLSLIFLLLFSAVSSAAFTSTAFLKGTVILKKRNTSSDTSEINRLTHLAFSSGTVKGKMQSVDNMKAYIDSAELLCRQANIEIPAMLHLARADYFFLTSDFSNAYQEATIAQKMADKSGKSDVLARTLNFLGNYSLRTGSFSKSIEYFTESIEIARKKRLKGYIPMNYWGISQVYRNLANQAEYRNTLQLFIDAAIAENDTTYIKSGYLLLGTDFTNDKRDFNKADSLLKKCFELSLMTNDTGNISHSLANLGWNSYLEKKYNDALEYYNRSLSYSVPSKQYIFSANSLGNKGTIYRDMGDVENSLKYYLESIEQAKMGNDIYDLQWVYGDMSEMYLRKKDTANAYLSFVLFKKYSDSWLKSTNLEGQAEAKIRYEADTRNKELELLSLRIKNQKLLIYGYTGLFVLCLAIGLLLLSRSRINTKRRISEMNQKISEVTQANLRQQMNPHFIFNTLNSIQYYMYQHDKLATNNYLTKFSSLMRKVLENSQHTSVPIRDELDALTLYLDLEKIRFKDKFDYVINVDEEIDPLLYKVPTMLIQPYVENSICHGLMPGNGNGMIKIDLKLKKEYISCIIEDNGIGREAAQMKKNKVENNHNSLGTRIVSSRLDLVNALYGTSLKTVYTDLKNDSGEPKGTRVEIHIPILS